MQVVLLFFVFFQRGEGFVKERGTREADVEPGITLPIRIKQSWKG